MSEPRQPAGTAFAIRDPLAWSDLEAIVRAAEGAGYDALFLPENTARDAFVTLGALAGVTRDLLLATGVVPMRSRTALLTAMAAATVHERAGGRSVLGIGTGDAGRGALDELHDYVADVRALLDGGTADRKGRPVRLALAPGARVPIWLSALGPRAMRLAGEIADGVLLNWCTPERVSFARERVAEGAGLAGRDPAEVSVGVYVRCYAGELDDDARTALKAAAGDYATLPAYARQLEQVGMADLAAVAADAFRAGHVADVPDELVEATCAVGERAADRLEAYRGAGADIVVVYPVAAGDVAASLEATLLALAPG